MAKIYTFSYIGTLECLLLCRYILAVTQLFSSYSFETFFKYDAQFNSVPDPKNRVKISWLVLEKYSFLLAM